MLDCLRTHRTKQELDAGLREKIRLYRETQNLADEIRAEIEAIIEKKSLDRMMAYDQI